MRQSVAKSSLPETFDVKLFLAQSGDGRSIARYRKGQVVFSQGEPADAIFYVQSGKIKLRVLSHEGKEGVVGVLGAGDFFGEGCLGGQTVRMATATAMTDCSIIRLDKVGVMRLIRTQRAFCDVLFDHLLSRNIRMEEDLVDHLFNSSEKRLARVLLLLANFGKDGKPEPELKITQATLAEIVGTTRSRISLFMNKFRELGYIEYNGTLTVHSSLLNVLLHD